MENSKHKHLTRQGYLIKKSELTQSQRSKIRRELIAQKVIMRGFNEFERPHPFPIFLEAEDYFILPRFYGIQKYGEPVKNNIKNGTQMNTEITLEDMPDILSHQKKADEALEEHISGNGGGCGVLSIPCGYGKTFLAIRHAIKIHQKTLVVVNKEFLMDQWVESIHKFTNRKAKIGIIQQNRIEIEDKDFVIAMLHTLSIRDFDKNVFADFGMAIIDECHHIATETFSQALPKIGFKYMLGLSATPQRKDGLSYVIHYFLGELFHKEKRRGNNKMSVRRILCSSMNSPHYETVLINNGKSKNTSKMLNNLAEFENRTDMIVDIIFSLLRQSRKILVLSSRRGHLHNIYDKVKQRDPEASIGFYYGNSGGSKKQHKNMLNETAKCSVILGTYSIASEGLDIPDINTEILATPQTEVEQSVGRILRKFHEKLNPLVIDIVDKCGSFERQAQVRKKLYKNENYIIEDFEYNLDNMNSSKLTKFIENEKVIQKLLLDEDDDEDVNEPIEPNPQFVKLNKCVL